jgi:hypothetical protein
MDFGLSALHMILTPNTDNAAWYTGAPQNIRAYERWPVQSETAIQEYRDYMRELVADYRAREDEGTPEERQARAMTLFSYTAALGALEWVLGEREFLLPREDMPK